MFFMYKGLNFIRVGNHLEAYRNGNLIGYARITEVMTLNDVIDVIKEFVEC